MKIGRGNWVLTLRCGSYEYFMSSLGCSISYIWITKLLVCKATVTIGRTTYFIEGII